MTLEYLEIKISIKAAAYIANRKLAKSTKAEPKFESFRSTKVEKLAANSLKPISYSSVLLKANPHSPNRDNQVKQRTL